MRKSYLTVIIGILVAVTGVDGTSARSLFSPQNHGAPPVFASQLLLPRATVGSKYTFNFCNPPVARACGGPFVPLQIDPSAGHGGPYVFTIKIGGGFLPTGLALGPRTGILTGIPVKSAARNGQPSQYQFSVCASDSSGRRCRRSTIWVDPAPTIGVDPDPTSAQGVGFVGNWAGVFTTIQWPGNAGCPYTLAINGAVTVTVAKVGESYQVDYFYIGSNATGCTVLEEQRKHITMSHRAVLEITGFSGDDRYFLTRYSSIPNKIFGTLVAGFYRVKFTFDRVP